MFDIERSKLAASRIHVEKNNCYKNALVALLTQDDLRDGCYVEGFAVSEFDGCRLPLEHAWIELPNGAIIDVSYAALDLAEVRYFPAVRLSRQRASRLVDAGKVLPYMVIDRSPRQRAAYRHAMAQAYDAMAIPTTGRRVVRGSGRQ